MLDAGVSIVLQERVRGKWKSDLSTSYSAFEQKRILPSVLPCSCPGSSVVEKKMLTSPSSVKRVT